MRIFHFLFRESGIIPPHNCEWRKWKQVTRPIKAPLTCQEHIKHLGGKTGNREALWFSGKTVSLAYRSETPNDRNYSSNF